MIYKNQWHVHSCLQKHAHTLRLGGGMLMAFMCVQVGHSGPGSVAKPGKHVCPSMTVFADNVLQDTHGAALGAGMGSGGKFRLPSHLPCTTTTLLLSWAQGGDVKGLVKHLLLHPERQHMRHGEESGLSSLCKHVVNQVLDTM